MLSVKWPLRAQTTYNWDEAYADNNPLTLQEAYDIAIKVYKEIFPEGYELRLDYVGLEDRFYSNADNTPLREMGGYSIRLRQLLNGIPLAASVQRTFTYADSNMRFMVPSNPFVQAYIVSADSYNLYCDQVAVTKVLYEDIPIVGYEKVKAVYEDLINAGNIRTVYSLQFSYVLYDNPEDIGHSFVAVPSWVAWCDYFDSPKGEPTEFDIAGVYYETSCYYPVMVNAQTGQLVDPQDMSSQRTFYPPIISW